MQCPLCSGPLQLDDARRFVCERGHDLGRAELERAAESRVSMALWMAIEALESQARALTIIAGTGDGGGGAAEHAEQAEADARILRQVVQAHAAETPPASADTAGEQAPNARD